MNCMNCGAFLVDKDLDYCPKKADLTNKEWNYVRQLRKQWKEEEEQIK